MSSFRRSRGAAHRDVDSNMSDLRSRVELMSHFSATPVESLYLWRMESLGFSAKAVMIKTDMTSDLLSVYFCLALFFLFFFTLLFSILVKEWVLQTSDTKNSRRSWRVWPDCEGWCVIQRYQPCLISESLLFSTDVQASLRILPRFQRPLPGRRRLQKSDARHVYMCAYSYAQSLLCSALQSVTVAAVVSRYRRDFRTFIAALIPIITSRPRLAACMLLAVKLGRSPGACQYIIKTIEAHFFWAEPWFTTGAEIQYGHRRAGFMVQYEKKRRKKEEVECSLTWVKVSISHLSWGNFWVIFCRSLPDRWRVHHRICWQQRSANEKEHMHSPPACWVQRFIGNELCRSLKTHTHTHTHMREERRRRPEPDNG